MQPKQSSQDKSWDSGMQSWYQSCVVFFFFAFPIRSDHEDLRGTVGIILPVGWKELKDEAEMKRGMLLSGSHSEVS